MAPKNTRKGGKRASKDTEEVNSKAETEAEATATEKAEEESVSMNSIAGRNAKGAGYRRLGRLMTCLYHPPQSRQFPQVVRTTLESQATRKPPNHHVLQSLE